jgi:lipopolysaccharide transport system ATP-binding protein
MSDWAIQVQGIGKLYRLGHQERYRTLRDGISGAWIGLFRSSRSKAPSPVDSEQDYIWALKNVSLEIQRGEVLGIIGRNGAGKSTFLKILSRITEPTEGLITLNGRVGSLLEVGTGFHAELSGRENIYLNGAILGMRRHEINRKFDEIVSFAEVERFIDTPVKHYSSGMYVRLAFAVAAYLESEILLVDEVLAVGDAVFQKKCLGKMDDVARQGRTVLFVSHNLGVLANLCPRTVLLMQGQVLKDGPTPDIIAHYIAIGREDAGQRVWEDVNQAPGNDKVRLHAVRIMSEGQVTSDVDIQKEINIQVEFWNMRAGARISSSIHLLDKVGVPVLATMNMHSVNLIRDDWYDQPHPVGLFRSVCTIPGNFLNEGLYSLNVIVLTDVNNVQVFAQEVVAFTVYDTGAMRKEFTGQWIGTVRPRLAWQTELLD